MSKKRITNFQMDSAKSIQFGYYLSKVEMEVICTRIGDGRWHVRIISEGKVYFDVTPTQGELRAWINHLDFVVDLFIKFDRL